MDLLITNMIFYDKIMYIYIHTSQVSIIDTVIEATAILRWGSHFLIKSYGSCMDRNEIHVYFYRFMMVMEIKKIVYKSSESIFQFPSP